MAVVRLGDAGPLYRNVMSLAGLGFMARWSAVFYLRPQRERVDR